MCFHILILGLLATSGDATEAFSQSNYSFGSYATAHGRTYAKGSSEYKEREQIFNEKVADIIAHNSMQRSWQMGVNQFTDRTSDELQQMRGYKRSDFGQRRTSSFGSSVLQLGIDDNHDKSCTSSDMSCLASDASCCSSLICGSKGVCEKVGSLAESKDWSALLQTSDTVLDQGSCGSCWAVAATAAIQLHAAKEFKKFNKILSPQSILSCTPNKMECGGTGGCGGATPELGFEWVKRQGRNGGVLPLDQEEYTASNGGASCEGPKKVSFLQTNRRIIPTVSIGGYTKVVENSASGVLQALSTAGPLAAAIVGQGIQSYSGGVIDSCHKNFEVDHAVVIVGYGNDPVGGQYWKIRNSWGQHWGENGYLRLRRHIGSDQKGEEPCGWDMKPEVGIVCKDANGKYPKKTWVCGECGIVSDVAYPVAVQVHAGLLM